MSERTGGCRCGAVGLELAEAPAKVHACHCETCRAISGGGPFFAIRAGTDVRWTGGEAIRVWRSSDWAERGFCGTCGAVLFYRLVSDGDTYVSAGLMPDASLSFATEVFIDEKPGWYTFANTTRRMTGEEVFAASAQGKD